MSASDILQKLQDKLGLTMYGLSKKLGLKSESHVRLLKLKIRTPNINTCKKIMKLCKESGIKVNLDMLGKDD